MAKGFTYTATDSKGARHARYSAGHGKPSFAYAVVQPGHDRSDNYCSRRDLADGEMRLRERQVSSLDKNKQSEILILDAHSGNVRVKFLSTGSVD